MELIGKPALKTLEAPRYWCGDIWNEIENHCGHLRLQNEHMLTQSLFEGDKKLHHPSGKL